MKRVQTIANTWLVFTILSLSVLSIYIATEEFWAWRERKRDADRRLAEGHERLLEDLLSGTVDPNVQAIVYQTKEGSTLQWHVPGGTDDQIIRHLTNSPIFKRIA